MAFSRLLQVAFLHSTLLLAAALAPQAYADFPDDYAGFVVVDKNDVDKTLAALLASGETHILLPQGVHQIDNPIVVNTSEPLVIHGAGRMRTRIEGMHPDEPLFIFQSVGPVSLAGIEFRKLFDQAPGSSLAPQDLVFDNAEFVDVQIQDSFFRAGSVEINGPGNWVVQGSHFDGNYNEGPTVKNWVDNGILLNDAGASVFVVGGNFGHFDNAHIQQIAGHLEVYGTGMQDHSAGTGKADIIITSPSPYAQHAHVIAAVRSEGNNSELNTATKILYVPSTEDEVNVVMKNNQLSNISRYQNCGDTYDSDSLVDYNGGGSIWLLGNMGGVNARHLVTGNGTGTVYSVGNGVLRCSSAADYFDAGPAMQVFHADESYHYRDSNNQTTGHRYQFIDSATLNDWSAIPTPFVPQNVNSGDIPVIHRPVFSGAPPAGFLENPCSSGPSGCNLKDALDDYGANLFIPAGTYTISNPLELDQLKELPGGMIAGAGKGQTIIQCTGCASVFKTKGMSYTTIQGITFKLTGTTGTVLSIEWPATSAGTLTATQGNNFYDVEIVGGEYGVGIGVVSPQQCSENLFVDSVFRNSSSQGVAIGQYNALANNFHHVVFRDSPWGIGYNGSADMGGTWGIFSADIHNLSSGLLRSPGGGRVLYHNKVVGDAATLFRNGANGNLFSYFFDNSDIAIEDVTSPGTALEYKAGQGFTFLRTRVSGEGTYLNAGDSNNFINSILSDVENLTPSVSTIYRRGFLGELADDADLDGIETSVDNCPAIANPDQTDIDGNLVGDACQHGLTANYFDGKELGGSAVLTRIDSNVDYDWQFSSPGSGVNSDYFSVRWTGRLVVPAYTGTYEFCLKGDDGFRLWVNETSLFGDDNWVPQDSVKNCANISLTAGQSVPIEVEFFDATEEAIVQMTWSYPGQVEQVVPSTQLYAQ